MCDKSNHRDWLRERVQERGPEKLKAAALAVFHRLRVVGLLIASSEEAEKQGDGQALVDWVRRTAIGENEIRQDNIKSFPSVMGDRVFEDGWQEIFDTSEEVIRDAVDWYGALKDYHQGGIFNAFITRLIKKIYAIIQSGEGILVDDGDEKDFGGLILKMVSEDLYGVRQVGGDGSSGVAEVDAVMRGAIGAFGERFRDFVSWISFLQDEFNRVYDSAVPSN